MGDDEAPAAPLPHPERDCKKENPSQDANGRVDMGRHFRQETDAEACLGLWEVKDRCVGPKWQRSWFESRERRWYKVQIQVRVSCRRNYWPRLGVSYGNVISTDVLGGNRWYEGDEVPNLPSMYRSDPGDLVMGIRDVQQE
jgi:hypothetical protein